MEVYPSQGLLWHLHPHCCGLYWIVNDSLKSSVSETTSLFLTFFFGTIYLAAMSLLRPLVTDSIRRPPCRMLHRHIRDGTAVYMLRHSTAHHRQPRARQSALLPRAISVALFVALFVGETIMPSTYIGLILIVGGIICNRYLTARNRLVAHIASPDRSLAIVCKRHRQRSLGLYPATLSVCYRLMKPYGF